MREIKVSIITVCFNGEQVLAQTIESVLHQTYENIEYIIIDGCSTDNSVKIARSFEKQFREKGYQYQVFSEPDRGIYDAMNKGIHMAQGELIGLINSGDWYEPNAVQRVIDTYRERPFDLFYADIKIWKRGSPIIKKARLRNYATTRDWNHPTTFIRASLYDRYQYACRGIYDDWDLILKIRNGGNHIEILNEVLANFTFGGISNCKSLKMAWKRGKERYRIYRENGYSRWYIVECIAMETAKYLMA